MATREEMALLRAARAGRADAQIVLGKRYLFGSTGLKQHLATALYWLDRAAQQGVSEAWMLIGAHVPFEVASKTTNPLQLCDWYERAFDNGIAHAGLVFAKIVLAQHDNALSQAMRCKALAALEHAATAGIAEAQWRLVKQLEAAAAQIIDRDETESPSSDSIQSRAALDRTIMEWVTRAANSGVIDAQRALAERAWSNADHDTFLHWALPIARTLTTDNVTTGATQLGMEEALLFTRCATALRQNGESDAREIERYFEWAAQAGDKNAQHAYGLWLANMDETGNRISSSTSHRDYKKSIRWLTLAGEQGVKEAWYALSKIFRRPNAGLTLQGWKDAQYYLERAASDGHSEAQFELGVSAWRLRRRVDSNDVRAVYWLQRAAIQGHARAEALLAKIAAFPAPAPWAQKAQRRLTSDVVNTYPFLAARIQLAAVFGLSCAEALLIDLNTADRKHSLLVDITEQHKKSKRRLILIRTGEERVFLTRIVRLFENIDCGPNGPEGSYNKRLYLFKKIFCPASEGTAGVMNLRDSDAAVIANPQQTPACTV